MTQVSIVAALSVPGRVIGKDGALPWHLPQDLKRFRDLTVGKPVIMGRRTWESVGVPLPKRRNIVVTSREGYVAKGAEVVRSIQEGLQLCEHSDEAMILGGESIYREALDVAHRLYLTYVEADVQGDAHFPNFDETQWHEVHRENFPADERNAYPMTFVDYQRRTDTSP